jgi:hypothetical protein
MITIGDLGRMRKELSKETFVARLGAFVLVGRRREHGFFGDDEKSSQPWMFVTRADAARFGSSAPVRTELADASPVYVLQQKRESLSSRLLVGRASSNDVCIDVPGVSKLHARIHVAPNGALTLTDAGSSNGTTVDGAAVTSAPVPLVHGSEVSFGGERLTLFATAELYDRLRR